MGRPMHRGKDRRSAMGSTRLPARAGVARLVVCGAVLTVAAACASGIPGSKAPTEGEIAYRVGASDQLTVRVLPEPEIDRKVIVRPDGKFSMDLIGDVQASGKTPSEIAADIQKRISVYRREPSVSVALESPASTAVSVLGEVKAPSSFPLYRDVHVSEAVAQSGGPTILAATSRVRVIRREGDHTKLYLVNLDHVQRGDKSTDMLLQRGDLIYVPAAIPVVVGYNIQRALYPFKVVLDTIAGPIIGFVAHP
jgi:polysaccharide export outer membrane protein